MDLIVLAKEPIPGRVKTRLCPPCTPHVAARLAAAALGDTLDAAIASGADRVLLALDGAPGPWLTPGVEVVEQGRGPLDRRLAHAWSHARGPALQIGMDTPQVTASELASAFDQLERPDIDAALGHADDGGWWALGMARPDPGLLLGIATSRPDTGARQHQRLRSAGLRIASLATHRDVDTYDDALAVAHRCSSTRFAAALRTFA